ncbi:Exocyst complex component 6B [Chelonia mydas]|uniref:Exocyst complex component 6B n=1 Tax=Chelonia mydas TaxID=8469 RepID=M7B470_CHEMY|nr:Exocyst complex component 6B [Chelonia mydas]
MLWPKDILKSHLKLQDEENRQLYSSSSEELTTAKGKVAQTACMSACKHLSTSLMQLLLEAEVRQLTLGALQQFNLDVEECEQHQHKTSALLKSLLGLVYTGEGDQSKLRNFSYVNNAAEVDVLRSPYHGVFTVVSRLLPLPCRLRLRLSRSWSTGVDGRALRGRFIASRLDAINRSPLDRSLPVDPAGTVDIPLGCGLSPEHMGL